MLKTNQLLHLNVDFKKLLDCQSYRLTGIDQISFDIFQWVEGDKENKVFITYLFIIITTSLLFVINYQVFILHIKKYLSDKQ